MEKGCILLQSKENMLDIFPEVKEITSGIIKGKSLCARFKIEIGPFAQRHVGKTRQNVLPIHHDLHIASINVMFSRLCALHVHCIPLPF